MRDCKWHLMRVKEGTKGWIEYEWAAKRVIVCENGMPAVTLWLLVRRCPLSGDSTFYLCYAPAKIKLKKLVQVASARWTIEQCFREAKGEAGLDHYQVRSWQGWHRHTLFSMMAHLFLAYIKRHYKVDPETEFGALTVPEIRRLLEIVFPPPQRVPRFIWHWSQWRRRHNEKARRSHSRCQREPTTLQPETSVIP